MEKILLEFWLEESLDTGLPAYSDTGYSDTRYSNTGYSDTIRSLPLRVTLLADSQGCHSKRACLY